MVESKNLVDVDLGFRFWGSESGFEETGMSFLEILEEERNLLTEDDGDDVDGSGSMTRENKGEWMSFRKRSEKSGEGERELTRGSVLGIAS